MKDDTLKQQKISERIAMLEAEIWAQEHPSQIMYLMSDSVNDKAARTKLKEQYGFTDLQAQVIIDGRIRIYTKESKMRLQEELCQLLNTT